MKIATKLLTGLTIGVLFYNFSFPPLAGSLILEVDNIRQPSGTIWVGVYDSGNYLDKEKAVVEGFQVQHTGSMKLRIPSLPYGTYAIALFHDLNDNGILDQNRLGAPTEPFAFSRLPKSKWRIPRFEEIQFRFYQRQQLLKTTLKNWWKM